MPELFVYLYVIFVITDGLLKLAIMIYRSISCKAKKSRSAIKRPINR